MKKNNLEYNHSFVFVANLFIKAANEARKKIYKELDIEISPDEYTVLQAIILNPGILQIDIAKKTLISRSYICKLLNKLIEMGYVRTENAIKGKKQIIIKNYATDKGLKIHDKLGKYASKIAQKIVFKDEDNKCRELSQYLECLIQRIINEFELKF